MGRYLGPKVKINRKFHSQIFGNCKAFQNRPTISKKLKKKPRITEYCTLLKSKKFILYTYNMRERQLSNYVEKATKKRENSEEVLARILESRLDNVVYRLGFATTRRACRQLVYHKHINVNNKPVDIASFLVKVGDIITFSEKAKTNKNVNHKTSNVNVYGWLKWDDDKFQGEITGLPGLKDIADKDKDNFKNIIEFYSR